PHLAGDRVAACLPLLQLGQRGAVRGVLGQDVGRRGRQRTTRQGGVEAGGIVTDGADVMHGGTTPHVMAGPDPAICARSSGGGWPGQVRPGRWTSGKADHHASTGFVSTSLAAMMEIS